MERIEPELAGGYRKDPEEEGFLDSLNAHLASHESSFICADPPEYPNLFVLGLPRSGTTVVAQTLINIFELGYVTNLMAAFWRAPVTGMRLQNKLLGAQNLLDYASDFGRTDGINGAHEFGYFWTEMLAYREIYAGAEGRKGDPDWARLVAILSTIVNLSGKPFLYKNVLLNWHARDLCNNLPRSIFVVVDRDPLDTACSLLKMRDRMLGSRQQWASAKPAKFPELATLSPQEQVAGQVHYLKEELEAQLNDVPEDRLVRINFSEFCANPGSFLTSISRVLVDQGWPHEIAKKELPKFSYKSASEIADSDIDIMRGAFQKFQTSTKG